MRFGFFDFMGVDPDRVVSEYGEIDPRHKEAVVMYLAAAKQHQRYRGMASSRMDGSMLGSADMITCDGEFVFPERWGEHYVQKYNISPPQEVVEVALEWWEHNKKV